MKMSQEGAKKFLQALRNNPKKLLTDPRYMMTSSRGLGKTTSASAIKSIIALAYVRHDKRMRGRYVHAHKNRPLRQHRRRVSVLDL